MNFIKKGSSGSCLDNLFLAVDTMPSLRQGELRGKVHAEQPVSYCGTLECSLSASAAAIVKEHGPESK